MVWALLGELAVPCFRRTRSKSAWGTQRAYEGRNEFDQPAQWRLERETRLELATPTLARSGSKSEYARARKWPCGAYFPAGSMPFDAELTAVGVKPRRPVGDQVRTHSCVGRLPQSLRASLLPLTVLPVCSSASRTEPRVQPARSVD
jgi:hypothetical protein